MSHDALSQVLKRPGGFALRALKGFQANQGLLLAGAVAYYTLLSLIPLLILGVIALSHWVDDGCTQPTTANNASPTTPLTASKLPRRAHALRERTHRAGHQPSQASSSAIVSGWPTGVSTPCSPST